MADYVLHIPAPTVPLSKNSSPSRFRRAQIVKAWRATAFQCAQVARLPKGLARVRIDVALRFATSRHRDEANYHDTAKPIVDALGPEIKYWRNSRGQRTLIYAPGYGLIANDTPQYLDGPHVTIGEVLPKNVYGPECVVTVTITDLSGEVD